VSYFSEKAHDLIRVSVAENSSGSCIHLSCAREYEASAQSLANTLINICKSGVGIFDGVTVEIGWSLLTLVKDSSNSYTVCEPDFRSGQVSELTSDLTTTIKVMRQQIALLNRVGLRATRCRYDQRVIVLKGALDRKRIYADRNEPKNFDSGWYLGAPDQVGQPSADELESIPLYHLLSLRPEIIDVLALPVGCIVVWDQNTIEALYNPEGKNLWSVTPA
jgi:hypothetical protein